jgi:hypothetical protein
LGDVQEFETSVDVNHPFFNFSEATNRPNKKILEQKHVCKEHGGVDLVAITWVEDAEDGGKRNYHYGNEVHPQGKPGLHSEAPLVS